MNSPHLACWSRALASCRSAKERDSAASAPDCRARRSRPCGPLGAPTGSLSGGGQDPARWATPGGTGRRRGARGGPGWPLRAERLPVPGGRRPRARRRELRPEDHHGPAEPWRRLKTRTSHRVIPLWPSSRPSSGPGSSAPGSSAGVPCWSPPGPLAARSGRSRTSTSSSTGSRARAGLAAGELRSKAFRHTYCAARLADARPRRAGEPLHGLPRAGPRLRGDGAPGLRPPG